MISRKLFLVAGVLLAIGLVGIGLGFDQLDHFPWEKDLRLVYPSLSVVDSRGNMHIVDSATRRIVSSDKSGKLLHIRNGGQRQEGFYYAYDLDLDSQDRLYVYNWVPEEGAEARTKAIQIIRYHSNGGFDRVILELKNSEESRDFPVHFSMSIKKDIIYYLIDDGKGLKLNKIDIDGKNALKVLDLPHLEGLVAIDGIDKGLIFALSRDGRIWRLDETSTWQALAINKTIKPWDIKTDINGTIWILDLVKREIRTIEQPWTDTDGTIAFKLGLNEGSPGDIFFLGEDKSLSLTEKLGQAVIVEDVRGKRLRLQSLHRGEDEMFRGMLAWTGMSIVIFACLLSLFSLAIRLFRNRVPLVLIQLIVFVPVISLAQVLSFAQVYQILQHRYQEQVKMSLSAAAQLAAKAFDAEALDNLRHPQDFADANYKRIENKGSQLSELLTNSMFSYFAIYRMQDERVYVVYTASGSFGVMYPYDIFPNIALETFNKEGVIFAEYEDEYGLYEAAFASVLNTEGKIVAVVEAGLFADLVKDIEDIYLNDARIFAMINALVFLTIFIILTLLILRSLNPLRRITKEITAGNMDVPVEIRGKDELGLLGHDFAAMAARLKAYLDDVTQLTKASARFVPDQFLDLLGVDDITKLGLGDNINKPMAVLFSSVQNFRKTSSHLSPQGVFNFLNSYLKIVSPRVQKHQGLIDKYMGDTYMALFPQKAFDAVSAVFHIRRDMDNYNRRRSFSGSEELKLNFGLHFGNLMMGIVGESNRMEGTVIADAVNLASRLNGLCRIYGVPFLSTEDTLFQILFELGLIEETKLEHRKFNDLKKLYPHLVFRRIDLVKVKGKKEAVSLVEICGSDKFLSHFTIAWIEQYEAAFEAWLLGDFNSALDLFSKLSADTSSDAVVLRHMDRIKKLLDQGVPKDWKPEVEMTEK